MYYLKFTRIRVALQQKTYLRSEFIKFNVKRPQIAKSKLGIGIGISAAFFIVQ